MSIQDNSKLVIVQLKKKLLTKFLSQFTLNPQQIPLALPSKYIQNPTTSQYLLHNHYSKATELLPINTAMVALLLPFLPFTIFSKLINLNQIVALFSKSTSSLLSHSEKSSSNCNGYKVLSCMTYDSQCLCDIIFHNPTYFLFQSH